MGMKSFQDYAAKLSTCLISYDWSRVDDLANEMSRAWSEGSQVFICGNGGSAGNATHLANDFLYGIAKNTGGGLRISSLSANSSVITCLANDISYEKIYSEQLAVLGQSGDILIVLSGSGNSKNIIQALLMAKEKKIKSFAILGFDGGKCKELADASIHFPVNDMQISEDLQLIVGHMVMQKLAISFESQQHILKD